MFHLCLAVIGLISPSLYYVSVYETCPFDWERDWTQIWSKDFDMIVWPSLVVLGLDWIGVLSHPVANLPTITIYRFAEIGASGFNVYLREYPIVSISSAFSHRLTKRLKHSIDYSYVFGPLLNISVADTIVCVGRSAIWLWVLEGTSARLNCIAQLPVGVSGVCDLQTVVHGTSARVFLMTRLGRRLIVDIRADGEMMRLSEFCRGGFMEMDRPMNINGEWPTAQSARERGPNDFWSFGRNRGKLGQFLVHDHQSLTVAGFEMNSSDGWPVLLVCNTADICVS
jgi:hypothetical protein